MEASGVEAAKEQSIESLDLWKALDEKLQKRPVVFVKDRAHNGHPQNELLTVWRTEQLWDVLSEPT